MPASDVLTGHPDTNARETSYYPDIPANWAGKPKNTQEAIDDLAASIAGNITSEKSWAFDSPAGSSGTFYYDGYYDFASTDNDFSGGPTFGTANASYAAHFMLVLGAATVNELTLRVTGTSITDEAVRTGSDTEDIVIPDSTAADAYYETSKKWIGQVTITVVSGTAKTCNYGWCKYWDNANSAFTVEGLDASWLAGANDAGLDIILRHHKAAGWTFNGGSTPTPPTPIAQLSTDHSTESDAANNENGAWKRTNLSTAVAGNLSEGTIIEFVTTANKAIELGNFLMRISVAGAAAGSNVSGPASSTDNAFTRWDTTTGRLVQDSLVLCDDSGNITMPNLASLFINQGGTASNVLDLQAKVNADSVVSATLFKGGRGGGVAGAGFGLGQLIQLENDTGNFHDAGKLEWVWDDATDTSEDCRLDISVMGAGSFSKMLSLSSAGLTIGSGAAGVDYKLTFVGENSTGFLTWMEDEDRFEFGDDVLMTGLTRINFNTTGAFIHAPTAGTLTLDATTKVTVGSPFDVPADDSAFGGDTLFVDVSDGRVGIGTTTPGYTLSIQEDTGGSTRGILVAHHQSSATAAAVSTYQRSRGTEASPTALASGDRVMLFWSGAYDGVSAYIHSAAFGTEVDGAVSAGVAPQAFTFRTGSGNFAGTERARFNSDGDLLLGGTVSPGGTHGTTMLFSIQAGDPTAPANTAGLFSKDVSASGELFAVDEADNVTQLSPHDPVTGRWVHNSENKTTGKSTYVDMERLVELVEQLSGEKLMNAGVYDAEKN